MLFSIAKAQVVDTSGTPLNAEQDSAYERTQRSVVDVLHSAFPRSRLFMADTTKRKADKVYFSVVPVVGYSLHTAFSGSITFNGAFYTDNPDSVNLSACNLNPVITSKRQFFVPLTSNIFTKKNKYNLVGNWTFFSYPENTYGLGGHTSLKNADPIDYSLFLFRETVLRSVLPDLYLGLGYNLDYHWNIKQRVDNDDDKDGVPNTDFETYGMPKMSISSGITYNFLYDSRRNPINPPGGGAYANIILRTNFTFLGSNTDWTSVKIDLRKYFKLPGSSRNVLAFWSYNWITLSGKPPYLDLPATAWDTYTNQGRGYTQSRFRGNDLVALEGEYRFGITHDGLFGGVVFANAQSVTDWPDNKFTTVWPAVGTGIRFKLNKYSNTNASIDYAVGLGGSRGLFVSLGEVF